MLQHKIHPLRKTAQSIYFMRHWLKAPMDIGAIMPSSVFLARRMAKQLDLTQPGVVVELGGGTGSLTRAILNTGIEHSRVVVIEINPHFAKLLKKQFPLITVINGNAAFLGTLLEQHGIHTVSNIISGIPFRSLPQHVREAIFQASMQVLSTTGKMIQFSYGLRGPLDKPMLDKLQCHGTETGKVWRNVPPAKIWTYQHQQPIQSACA